MRAMKWVREGRLQTGVVGAVLGALCLMSGVTVRAQTPTAHAVQPTSATAEEGERALAPPPVPQAPTSQAGASPPTVTTAPVVVTAPSAVVTDTSGSVVPKRADALAMTVSGAVSLGSHEAGQLFLITEALRKSPQAVPLRVATGASAGSANALISATEACLVNDLLPEQSLGYRAWVDVGLDQLFDPKRTTRQAIFHKDALERSFGYLEDRWSQGLPASCDFAYGVAVTRKSSVDMKVADGLVIPRSAERFIVRLEGQKAGPPRFFNYVDEHTSYNRPLLPFTNDYVDDAEALRPVVLASAAFPVAFSPQPIQHCILGEAPANDEEQCSEPTHVDSFVDGGVFDNNPLGIAYRTARAGVILEGGEAQLREKPDGSRPGEVDVFYGYVDPDLRTYPLYTPPHVEKEPEDDPVLSLVTRMGGQMLADARGHELASLADENMALLEDLWLIRANYPPVSELLSAFFGFFERDFRDFDFHIGSYDSFVDLRDHSAVRLGVEPYIEQLDGTLQGDVSKVPERYRKLGCIASKVGEKKYRHLGALCEGKDMHNFRVLLQVAVDRLWSNCRFLSAEQVELTSHLGCKQARGGLPPPLVHSGFSVKGARYQLRGESDFDYTIRLLGDYGFHFRDLGLDADDSQRARVVVRRKLIAMVEALSAAQGSYLNRTAVMTGGRTLINSIYYEPPRKRAYVGVGSSIFAGYLGRLGGLRYLYWNPDVRMLNIRELLSDREFNFSAQASLGLEFAILGMSGSVWQTAMGVRGGYQFSSTDAIGIDPCNESSVDSDSRRCSGPVIHTPVNFTLLERVRFSLTPVFYPLPRDFGHKWFELEVGIGAELY